MFEVGDVVYLKSGSPRMTVVDIDLSSTEGTRESGWIATKWVTYKDGALQSSTFPVEALKFIK